MGVKRLEYFDIARGIGVICMMIGHMGIPGIYNFVYTFHMPLFIFISGCLFKPAATVGGVAKKQAVKLLVPYGFGCLLTLLTEVAIKLVKRRSINTILDIAKHRIFTAGFGIGGDTDNLLGVKGEYGNISALWFFLAIFWALIIMNVLLKFEYKSLAVMAVAFLGYYIGTFIYLPWALLAGMVFVFFLYAGYCAKETIQKRPSLPIVVLCLAVWLVSYFTYGVLDMANNAFPNGLLDIVGAIAGSYLVVWVSRIILKYMNRFLGRALSFFGRYSLLIVCIHSVEYATLPWFKIHMFFPGNKIAAFFVVIVLRLFIVLMAVFIVKRIPFLSKIFSIKIEESSDKDRLNRAVLQKNLDSKHC